MDVVGRGRDADVVAAGPGRVTRRNRIGRDDEPEARLMTWVHQHGMRVPEVFAADGPEITMQRLDGPTLAARAKQRPWTLWHIGVELARFHRLLDVMPLPPWLQVDDPSLGLVHFDVHPDNVMLHDGIPYLIDWTNARAGSRAEDVAVSWIILRVLGLPDRGLGRWFERFARAVVLRAMLHHVDRAAVEAALPDAIRYRLRDRNALPAERAALQSWLTRLTP